MTEPWRAWADLAGGPWRHRLELPGATLLAETSGLVEDAAGWMWSEERVWRLGPGGPWLLARTSRRSGDAQDGLLVLAAATPDALARRALEALGRSPGLIELLGRAGVELGLAPDDVVEGDEIDDWPAEPPPSRRGEG
ncbi:MAG: hypothetical protein KF878_21850 [Planctomycetes bacterium]|nr:hypothetical protein [Planctomycetota bacterium]